MGSRWINFLFLLFLFCPEVYSKQELAVIKDSDGFVNVRLGKSESSRKLFEIRSAEIFVCEPTNENWWHVQKIDGEESGFMYKNKVSLLKNHPLAKSQLFPTRLSQIEKVDRMFKSRELVRSVEKESTSKTPYKDENWFTDDSADQEMLIGTGCDMIISNVVLYLRNVVPQKIDEDAINNPEIMGLPRKKIARSFFVTERGLKLGDTKEKAFKLYGKPTIVDKVSGYEKYEWDYVGIEDPEGESVLDFNQYNDDCIGRAKKGYRFTYGFGYKVKLFFKEGKLAALILERELP
jgi:hypothetical protein